MPIWRFGFGPFTLDLATAQLLRDGRPLAITSRDLAVLRCLVVRSGQVVSTDEILDSVWAETFVVRGVVKAAVHRVRAVLNDSVPMAHYIETVGRHGYRFAAEVSAEVTRGEDASPDDSEREVALGRLRALLAKARSGERQIVFAGDPSPSRVAALVEEFIAGAEHDSPVWCARGDCLLQHAASEPCRPVVEALRRLCRGPLADEVVAVMRRHAPLWLERVQGVRASDPTRVMPGIGELVDALDALAAILPFVLVIEDLHWADPDTLDFVSTLATSRAESRLLVLATYDAARRRDPGWPLASLVQTLTDRDLAVELEAPPAPAKAANAPAPILGRLHSSRMPFVGRADELGLLLRRLEQAQVGAGSISLLSGEPGIGKTRLLGELAARARAAGAQVLAGRCDRADLAPPFGAIAEALAAHVRETDEPTLREELGAFGGIVGKVVPALRERLADLETPKPISPDEERRRLLDALVQTFWSIARRTPLVLIIDDLHWADAGTLALLRHAVRFLRRHRVLVIGAYRDAEVDRADPFTQALAEIRREGSFDPIGLGGLDRDSVASLLAGLGVADAPAAFVDALCAETAGNPFFCRELLLHLVEEGSVGSGVDPALWARAVREADVPDGVREVVSLRLARLPEEVTRLLTAASGFAAAFRFDVVAAGADLDEKAALDALDAALQAQLVREAGEPERYEFTHALVRSALYTDLSSARQLRLHRRLATELERMLGESAGVHAFEIAQQWHRSAALPGAEAGVRHCVAAAERAERAAAHHEAAAALRMALELAAPADPRLPRLMARLGLALAWSLALDDATDVALRAAEGIAASEGSAAAADYLADAADAIHAAAFDARAGVLAERGLHYIGARRDLTWARLVAHDLVRRDASDPDLPAIPVDRPEAREASRLIVASWQDGDERAVVFGTTTTMFDSLADVRARGMGSAPIAAFWAGDYRGALATWAGSAERYLERGQLGSAALHMSTIARCKLALGDPSGAEHEFPKALEIAQRAGNPVFMRGFIGAFALELVMFRGEQYETRIDLIDAMVAEMAADGRWETAMGRAFTALFRAHAGRVDDALAALERVLPAIERAPGWVPNYTAIVCYAIEALWVLECADHAERLEANLRDKTLKPDFRYAHVDARLSLARLCALTGREREARDWFDAARHVLDEQGALPLRAIADLDEARMERGLGKAGDRARAEALLCSARERFAALGMPGWLRRADELAARS